MLLAGQILEFCDPGVGMLLRVIHDRRDLEVFPVMHFMLEFQRTIRKLTEAISEIIRQPARSRPSPYTRSHPEYRDSPYST